MTLLIRWGRVIHICICKLTIIGSDNGLSPGRRQAIIWTNDGTLQIPTLGTNFSETFSEIHTFKEFKEMHLKMSSGKWQPFCLGLNVLTLLVLWPEYSRKPRSILWLLMPLALSIVRSSAVLKNKINGSLSSMRKDLNYLHHLSCKKF